VMFDVKTTKLKQSWTKVDYLFWFLASWTIIQFAMCVGEFIHFDTFTVPTEMPFAYFLLILIYVLRKEVDRWLRKAWKKRKGELFLVGWWFALLIMFIIEFKTLGKYSVPNRMINTCFWILIPYGVTTVSKIINGYLKRLDDINNLTDNMTKSRK